MAPANDGPEAGECQKSSSSPPDTPRPRARAGLPAGAGAWRAGILRAAFGFDYTPHGLTLLDALAPPTARELEILREYIDLGRGVIGRTAKS